MSIRQFVAAFGIAAISAGCAENTDPFGSGPQSTIEIPGNTVGTSGCVSIDNTNCFAILDNQIKILYERNNWAARRGEAEYRVVTGSNRELADIFNAETRTVAEATRRLDLFISAVENGLAAGDYGSCWGTHILEFGQWVRAKVATGNLDVSDAPQMNCWVSPVASVSGSGSEENGVVLTVDDPWHFSGDPYGIYPTQVYFVVQGPSGRITTAMVTQKGPTTVTIRDPLTTTVGPHAYSVMQCADWGQCSEAVTATVTVNPGAETECVHDNRDKLFSRPLGEPKCEKEIKPMNPKAL